MFGFNYDIGEDINALGSGMFRDESQKIRNGFSPGGSRCIGSLVGSYGYILQMV